MAEDYIHSGSGIRDEQYKSLIPQIKALTQGEPDLIANLANICAALKTEFEFLWVGFYLVQNEELVLGPFQGPVACTRIEKGKGVCGKAFETGQTQLVDDVNAFPGHIACSPLSKSEIVVPIKDCSGNIRLVLDIDSDQLGNFSEKDKGYLEEIGVVIRGLL